MYGSLLSWEVMTLRVFDWLYFEHHGLLISKYFDDLNLTKLCTKIEPVYPALFAYFYSNLSFPSPNQLIFRVKDKFYTLTVKELASILYVSLCTFIKFLSHLKTLTKLSQEILKFLEKTKPVFLTISGPYSLELFKKSCSCAFSQQHLHKSCF